MYTRLCIIEVTAIYHVSQLSFVWLLIEVSKSRIASGSPCNLCMTGKRPTHPCYSCLCIRQTGAHGVRTAHHHQHGCTLRSQSRPDGGARPSLSAP